MAEAIDQSCLSTVNVSKLLGRFTRDHEDAGEVRARLVETAIEVVPFSTSHAEVAASLVLETRPLGLALGDRACLALAVSRRLTALTADRVWSELEIGVAVEILR